MKNKWIYVAAGILVVAIVVIIAVSSSNKKNAVDIPTVSDEITDVFDQQEEYLSEDSDTLSDESEVLGSEQEMTDAANGSVSSSNGVPTTNAANGKSEAGSFVASDGTKFDITLVEDVLSEGVLIKWVKVKFSEYVPESKVRLAANKVVEHLTSIKDVNGIGIDCYYTEDVSGMYNVARVLWAPYGDWNETASVKAGDYTNNDYFIMMAAEPEPLPDTIAGVPYQKAQQAYAKYFSSQGKIQADAMSKYPDDAILRQTYITEQNDKLINEIYKEYNMKSDAIAELILAGLKYNWSY